MRVLVTGATGFIGGEIVAELVENRIDTVQIGRRRQISARLSGVESPSYFQADIADRNSLVFLEKLVEINAVVHCAGLAHQFKNIDGREFEKVNVRGTKNILELAVKLKVVHFILISSTAVYGIKKLTPDDGAARFIKGIDEDDECCPETPYAESKLQAEKTALDICAENNISLTILRLAPVIGEGSAGNVDRLIQAVDKKRFVWIGDGKNLKSLIYKKDAARMCVKILKEKKAGIEIFNLAGRPAPMRELVDCIAESLGRKIPPVKIPPFILRLFFRLNWKIAGIKKIDNSAWIIEKWLSNDVYSTDKIAAAYNFQPETSVFDAVKRQVARYESEKD